MNDIIYDDRSSAIAACKEYLDSIHDLQTKLGVWEVNDDDCVATRIFALYRNDSGKVVEYCH